MGHRLAHAQGYRLYYDMFDHPLAGDISEATIR
jgi:hypothetical protein